MPNLPRNVLKYWCFNDTFFRVPYFVRGLFLKACCKSHWGSWNYSTWSLWQKLYFGSSTDCMLTGCTPFSHPGMDDQLLSPWRVVKCLIVAARKRHQGRAVGLETPERSSVPLLLMMPLTSAERGAVRHTHGSTQQVGGEDTPTRVQSLKWKTSLGPPNLSLLQSGSKVHPKGKDN